jgi:hypothetical protein
MNCMVVQAMTSIVKAHHSPAITLMKMQVKALTS